MTELKTLKDLAGIVITDPVGTRVFHSVNSLRAEAIEWVKEFMKHSTETDCVVETAPYYNYTHGMRCGAILFLKQFFNLTEDDLK